MHHLHDQNDPRHARMFELLRQREIAQGTVRRLSVAREHRADVPDHFLKTALHSLARSEPLGQHR